MIWLAGGAGNSRDVMRTRTGRKFVEQMDLFTGRERLGIPVDTVAGRRDYVGICVTGWRANGSMAWQLGEVKGQGISRWAGQGNSRDRLAG